MNEETRCVPVEECVARSPFYLFIYLFIHFLWYAVLFINTTFGGPPNSQNQSKQFESKQFESKQFISKQFISKQSLSKQFISKQLIAFFSSKRKQLLTYGRYFLLCVERLACIFEIFGPLHIISHERRRKQTTTRVRCPPVYDAGLAMSPSCAWYGAEVDTHTYLLTVHMLELRLRRRNP
jgi:hypothetical protein